MLLSQPPHPSRDQFQTRVVLRNCVCTPLYGRVAFFSAVNAMLVYRPLLAGRTNHTISPPIT